MAAAPRLPESGPGTSTRAQSVKQIDLYTPAAVNGGYSWFSTGDPSGSGEPNLGWSHLAVVDPSYPSSSSASLTRALCPPSHGPAWRWPSPSTVGAGRESTTVRDQSILRGASLQGLRSASCQGTEPPPLSIWMTCTIPAAASGKAHYPKTSPLLHGCFRPWFMSPKAVIATVTGFLELVKTGPNRG